MGYMDGDQPISKYEDVIDSRDVIARIEYLQALLDDEDVPAGHRLTEEEAHELAALLALRDEGEGFDDWIYGETLIHEDYFVDYMREMVQDIGDLPREIPGYLVIDWEATADNLRVDYSEIEYDGQTYYIR